MCCLQSALGAASARTAADSPLCMAHGSASQRPNIEYPQSVHVLHSTACGSDSNPLSTAAAAAGAAQPSVGGPCSCYCYNAQYPTMHSSSSAAMQPGPFLTSLPIEALACIASLLEQPDRHAFALTCTASCQAVNSTTTSLVLPVANPTLQQQQQQSSINLQLLQRYPGVQSFKIRGCELCTLQQQQQQQQCIDGCCPTTICIGVNQQQLDQQTFTVVLPGLAAAGTAAAAAAAPRFGVGYDAPSQLQQSHTVMEQQQQMGQHSVTAVQGAAAAAAMGSDQHQSAADIRHLAQQHPVPNTGSSSSLMSMVAAAGSSMPYLTSLDLSGVCMHGLLGNTSCSSTASPTDCTACRSPNSQISSSTYSGACSPAAAAGVGSSSSSTNRGLLATICTACPNLTVLSLPGWLWQGLGSVFGAQYIISQNPGAAHTAGGGLVIQVTRVQLSQAHALGLKQAMGLERLEMLAGLSKLRVLRMSGGVVPAEALADIGLLTQLHCLSIGASSDVPLPSTAAAAATAASTDLLETNTAASSSSSGRTALGTALTSLTSLVKLSLSGLTESGSGCLDQLSNLTNLTSFDLKDSSDLKVQSLVSISGLSRLRVLRIRRVRSLQAKSRASLPLEWQNLKQLSVMLLDFDLHLRDIQVLAGIPQLTLLGAASLHICVNPLFGLAMPNIKHLALHTLPQLPLAAAAVPAAAAVQPAVAVQQAVHALQQQQQFVYMQQQGMGLPVPQPLLLPQLAAVAAIGGQQQQQQQLVYVLPGQGLGAVIPMHGLGVAMPQNAAAAAAAGAAGQVFVIVNNQLQQQQQQQPPLLANITSAAAAPAAAAAAAVADQGWLSQLCPNLEELMVGVLDMNAFQAMKGHPSLKRVAFGIASSSSSSSSGSSSSGSNSSSNMQLAAGAVMAPAAAAAAAAVMGWSVLSTLPNLDSIKLSNTGVVLPANCHLALPHLRSITSLCLQQASCISTLEAWLMSCCCTRLENLVIEDAPYLTDPGLRHLAALPSLRSISLTACPSITHLGLQQLLLYCRSLQAVHLSCCTAIHADMAEAVQQAVQLATGRKVAVHWRSERGAQGYSRSRSRVWG